MGWQGPTTGGASAQEQVRQDDQAAGCRVGELVEALRVGPTRPADQQDQDR